MPLTGKYLKCSPEITLGIFTLVWDKLISRGWKPYSNQEIQNVWRYLTKNSWHGIRADIGNKFIQYKNDKLVGLTETTVQEILGYDPFIKDDFVLPGKWYVRVTKENYAVLNNWRINVIKYSENNFDIAYQIMLQDGSGGFVKDHENETEITFEQFKKYVLKESIEETKKVIPEYVEFIKDNFENFTKGKIYRLDSEGNCQMNNGEYTKGSMRWPKDSSYIEPSTKEAFDAQNKPKQSLKQAVHCTTQEEWDFVTEKLNYKWIGSNWYGEDCYINALEKETANKSWWLSRDYQILSFQEWCNLNGYKMEKEVKFEVGKWYKANYAERIYFLKYKDTIPRNGYNQINYSEFINDGVYKTNDSISNTDLENSFKVLDNLEEVQRYLPDNHPDKITPIIQQARDMQSRNNLKKGDYLYVLLPSHCGDILEITGIEDESKYEPDSIWISHKNESFSGGGFRCSDKVYPFGESFRLATPEEIHNHLISIRQIPVGEPLNTGIEPNKDGAFKYTTYSGTTHVGKTSTISGPLKMTLSIDDEELPMVNIIKTNTIKQLLNND